MRKYLSSTLIFTVAVLGTSKTLAGTAPLKGSLPEIQMTGNEDDNQKKAMQSEVLISKAEQKAITALLSIIKRHKSQPDEPELLNRLAELYLRRAKTGRFLDINRKEINQSVTFMPEEVRDETAAKNLKQAVSVYSYINKNFPKYKELDEVLFNLGFAYQQLRQSADSQKAFQSLLDHFPKSVLAADAHLSLGELMYNEAKFSVALEHFQAVQNFKNSKVYSYGLYKTAWTYYNLHESEKAIQSLIQVVQYFDPEKKAAKGYNLRGESLKDLALFFEESSHPEEAYAFFSKVTTGEELGQCILQLAKIYASHSRYKDLQLTLREFSSHNTQSPQIVQSRLLVANSFEATKSRPEVIHEFEEMVKICQPDSDWSKQMLKNKATVAQTYELSCHVELPHAALEMGRKWWEIWLKNKQHKEFAELTLKMFHVYLQLDDPKAPDSKSRYAYAELLFQLGKFKEASAEYFTVGERTNDTQLKHDADYGALVALEKSFPTDDPTKLNNEQINELLKMALRYNARNPKADDVLQVQFKIGLLYYAQKNWVEEKKWLTPLTDAKIAGTHHDLLIKSQDILLDTFNFQKDFPSLQTSITKWVAETDDLARKISLRTIRDQARLSLIQKMSDAGDQSKASEEYLAFAGETDNQDLAKESLWRSLSLNLASDQSVQGADKAMQFISRFPKDSRTPSLAKDAARIYSEHGMLEPAVSSMQIWMSVDNKMDDKARAHLVQLYLLDGHPEKALAEFDRLDNKSMNVLIAHFMEADPASVPDSVRREIESKIQQKNIQPYAYRLKLVEAETELKSRHIAKAFDLSKKLMSESGVDESERARARLIQAKILDDEFMQQSVRGTVERLSTTLSLKTEKLDKAQTALAGTIKMTSDPAVQLEALTLLEKTYAHYVEVLNTGMVKGALDEAGKAALETELEKLRKPMKTKITEIQAQIETVKAKIAKSSDGKPGVNDPTGVQNSGPRQALYEKFKGLTMPRPVADFAATTNETNPEKKAQWVKLNDQAFSQVQARQWTQVEKSSADLMRTNDKSPAGMYYMMWAASHYKASDRFYWELGLVEQKFPAFYKYLSQQMTIRIGDGSEK